MDLEREELDRNLAKANARVENGGRVIKRQIALIQRLKHDDQFAEAANAICGFLGDRVTGASAVDARTLRVSFSKGVIDIFDNSGQYESFAVRFPGRDVIV